MLTSSCAISTKELADKVKDAVDDANKGHDATFSDVSTEIEEIALYETEEEIPILNGR